MSGSAANAAARRRRVDAVPVPVRQQQAQAQQQQTPSQVVNSNNESTNRITPLQILQNHEEQLKNLTENLNDTINEILDKKLIFYTEKIKELIDNHNALDIKLDILVKQNSNNNNNNNNKGDIIDFNNEFSAKLDEFKNMLIKNQASVLEFSNQVFNLKGEVNKNRDNIDNLSKLSKLNEKMIPDDKNSTSTQMLFESLLKNSLFQENFDNRNILDTDNESEKEDYKDYPEEISLGEEIILGEADLIENVDIKHEIQEAARDLVDENKKIDVVEDRKIIIEEEI
tara:strand:- start:671 stop:1522 length:852 start_codon:yes stop_codon:yes gene_type:complete